jgi:hypothetical protein
MFGNPDLLISNEGAALTIACFDIILVLVFWIGLICLKPMISAANKQVIKESLTGPDFTVQV